MFNDKYGLTRAVLEGRKTMTRRIVPELKGMSECDLTEWGMDEKGRAMISLVLKLPFATDYLDIFPRYQPGEVVAVAQAYRDIPRYNPETYEDVALNDGTICEASHPYSHLMQSGGWDNKMFVRADLMPHQIRITNIHIERLQDISEEDCFREGIDVSFQNGHAVSYYRFENSRTHYFTPREAFAALIDKVSGKGTWESNPYVFVYEFELIK